MDARSDLAVELNSRVTDTSGIICTTEKLGIITVTKIRVINKQGEKSLGKPMGNYVNVDIPDLLYHGPNYEELENIIVKELTDFSFPKDNVLVAGLGNRSITPDALGPKVSEKILATRHLSPYLKEQTGLTSLKSVSVIQPGVLGQTGIETLEIIKGVIASSDARGLIVIDAFAAAEPERLGTTIQLCDSGISPGSGVGNDRKEISEKTVGIPVIAVGVPTCLDAALFGSSTKRSTPMIVTPREIDLLIDRAAATLSASLNLFLQPSTDKTLLLSIV